MQDNFDLNGYLRNNPLLKETKSPEGNISSKFIIKDKFEDYTFDEIKKVGYRLTAPYRYPEDEVEKAEEIYRNIGLFDENGDMYDPETFDLSKKTKDGKTLKDLAYTFA